MKLLVSFVFISTALLQAAESATVKFNIIAPGASDVKVSVNGQQVSLTSSINNIPYFSGTAEVGASKEYKYVVSGAEEPFSRVLDPSRSSTLNDFHNRSITYANIPKLPWPIANEPQWTREGDRPALFDENYIPTIFFSGDPEAVKNLVKNVPQDYIPGTLTVITADNVQTFQNVNFGIHGSGKKHNNAKQSWHWQLSPGDQLAKRSFFKLRHMEEDPTQIRERLYSDVLHALGTYANEANMVRLFINGEEYGTFNLLDDITELSYIHAMFYGGQAPSKKGLLYDGMSGADYAYHTNIYDGYTSWRPNRENAEGYEALDRLCKKFNETNVQDKAAMSVFDSMFDTDRFLRFMVVEYLAGHWDGYWMEQTNDGTYKEGETNKWYYLGQDFDATFGVNLAVANPSQWMSVSYKEWPTLYPKAIMINRLLENPEKRAMFEAYLTETVRLLFNNVTLTNRVLALHEFLLEDLRWDRSIVQKSPGINFGWNFDQVTQNLWGGVVAPNMNGGGAFYGLVEWIVDRSNAVAKEFGIKIVTEPAYPPNANRTIVPGGAPAAPSPPPRSGSSLSNTIASATTSNTVQTLPTLLALLAVALATFTTTF